MSEGKGPIYGVSLIDTLPLGGGMQQYMASRDDLVHARSLGCERLVASYELALAHLAIRAEEVKLLNGTIAALESMCRPHKVIDGSGL